MELFQLLLNDPGVRSKLLSLTLQHFYLSILGVLVAVLVGVPIGVILTRNPRLRGPVLSLIDILQTIPSLALMVIMAIVMGFNSTTLVFTLGIYSLLPIVRNTYTGIIELSPGLIEAATGMGMHQRQVLFKVQLPLALPVLLTGFRVALVTAIGIATIGVYIGAGGLGWFIDRGISMNSMMYVTLGTIPAVVMALGLDFLLSGSEKRLVSGRAKS